MSAPTVSWRLVPTGSDVLVAHAVRVDRVSYYADRVAHHVTVCGRSAPSTAPEAVAESLVCPTCERSRVAPPDGQLTLDVVTGPAR